MKAEGREGRSASLVFHPSSFCLLPFPDLHPSSFILGPSFLGARAEFVRALRAEGLNLDEGCHRGRQKYEGGRMKEEKAEG
jgi:hypothetical protein